MQLYFSKKIFPKKQKIYKTVNKIVGTDAEEWMWVWASECAPKFAQMEFRRKWLTLIVWRCVPICARGQTRGQTT